MDKVDKKEQGDTEESDFDPDFKLEPLPRAADIIAELPDYPDSDEEEEVRNIMQMIPTPGDENNEENDLVTVESIDKKREPSPIISPVKQSLQSDSNNSISPPRKSKRQRIEAPKVEPKLYLNKHSEFLTGFNPMNKEAKYRRQMRMQRFGKHEKAGQIKDKAEMVDSKLEEDSDESDNERDKFPLFDKRPEAIHLYGTDDLSTDDIFAYFADYSPHNIEWIDDTHCNVVWSDTYSAKRALVDLSTKFTAEELTEKKAELRQREKDEDEFYLGRYSLDRPPKGEEEGVWRRAVKDDPKAHLLFMRYATTGDVKKRGAYKNSRYYSIHGNPNAPYLKTNKYPRSKQFNGDREERKTNQEIKRKKKEKSPPDLRRHLNKGKIDVDQIKEEYKLGKPLIETLTIEVDGSEKTDEIEVRKDSDTGSGSDNSFIARKMDTRTIGRGRRAQALKAQALKAQAQDNKSSSSSSSSDSSSSSSSSSSESSDSSDSSSSSDSSEERTVKIQKKKTRGRRQPDFKKTKSIAVVRPVLVEPVKKLSSAISTVQHGKTRGRKRSGSPTVALKRAKNLPVNDLRAKLKLSTRNI